MSIPLYQGGPPKDVAPAHGMYSGEPSSPNLSSNSLPRRSVMKFFALLLLACTFASAVDPFTIVIKTDNAGTSASNQFTLPLRPIGSYNFSITWGDGGPSEDINLWNSPQTTHSYASAGTYTVQISEKVTGGFPQIFFNLGGDRLKLLRISNWGGNTWSSMLRAFAGCENLTITATDEGTAQTGGVTNFSGAWTNCSSLTSFPLLPTQAGTDFSAAWFNCSGLTSFPPLNTAAGTTFESAWTGCRGLTSFPLLDTSAGTHFRAAWFGCTSLTSFPLINTAAATRLDEAWINCAGLTAFPHLVTTHVTDFTSAWRGCSGLTSFPSIDTSAGTTIELAWYDCGALTSFPALVTTNVTNFGNAWYGCSGLTSFPALDTAKGTNFIASWFGCSRLSSFPAIDTAEGIQFTYAWYGCSGLTTFPVIETGKGTEFAAAWAYCDGLTSFPQLNTGKSTSFSSAWSHCFRLTSFPLIDTSKGTDFSYAWANCSWLATFPPINTAAGSLFDHTWFGCTSLTAMPSIDLSHMTDGASCFSGVTLSAASYSDLLINLVNPASPNTNTAVTFDGGFSTYDPSAASARNTTLIAGLGWTITDGGATSPPVITSITVVDALVNSPISYQITAIHAPTSYAASGLPTGLTIDTTMGLITGTSSVIGVSTITISATNAGGTGSAVVTLSVSAAGVPFISSPNTTTGITSQPFTYTITASNSPTGFNATGLPAGLSVNTANGVISGTPTIVGSSTVTLQATNVHGTGLASLTITVSDPSGTGSGDGSGGGGGGGCGLGAGLASAFFLTLGLLRMHGLGLRRRRDWFIMR
jgi:hypothetical protein